MFGKKKTEKKGCKCVTKSCSGKTSSKTSATSSIQSKACHNLKASDMTSGSRSTKSCGAKSSVAEKSCGTRTSKSSTKSCAK